MPFRVDKMTIGNPENDNRVKLSDADRKKIVEEFKTGLISQRALARKYNVSRRLISFILDPEKAERAKEQYKERRKDGRYYKREKHNEAMKRHRSHKRELDSKGLLKEEEGCTEQKPKHD